jgi:hypothetical protein
VWQYGLFNHARLVTTSGEITTVVHPGTYNTNSGPDFLMAKIYIGNTLWVGNIEIHLKTSDWKKHHHHHDNKYDNVILHVVYEHDTSTESQNVSVIELRNIIDASLMHRYKKIMEHKGWIPCEKIIQDIDYFRFKSGLVSLAVERLQKKTDNIIRKFNQNNNSWEETLYHSIAYAYGLKINADAFEKLACSVLLKIIGKHKNNLMQIEALLFGQAGLLNSPLHDEYAIQLKNEFTFLKEKYQLKPMQAHEWHFLRLRPAAFPTVRIAQFAMFLHQSVHLFSKIKEINHIKTLEKLFESGASPYWKSHYRFDAPSTSTNKSLGTTTIRLIIINSIIPVLFAYGITTGNDEIKERALSLLEQLPAELNAIIRKWSALKHTPENALESQALIELKNNYCDKKQCLKCHVGTYLLKNAI